MSTKESHEKCHMTSPIRAKTKTKENLDSILTNKEKDKLINQLRVYIFELEQNHQDYNELNQKYKKLYNDYTLLSNSKLKLECELQLKNEKYSKENSIKVKGGESLNDKKEDTEKDKIICRLKERIKELEKNEKDYNSLNQKYEKLSNDYTLLNNAKSRMEYELSQRGEELSNLLNSFKGESEILQRDNNSKISLNKKLYSDIMQLIKDVEVKNKKILELNKKIKEVTDDGNKKDEIIKNQNVEIDELEKKIKDLENKVQGFSQSGTIVFLDTPANQLKTCTKFVDKKSKEVEGLNPERIYLKKVIGTERKNTGETEDSDSL